MHKTKFLHPHWLNCEYAVNLILNLSWNEFLSKTHDLLIQNMTRPNFISQFSHTKKNAITLINTQYLLSDLDNSLPVILSSLSMTCITHLILHNKFHHKHLLQYRWIYHLQWKKFYQSVLHFQWIWVKGMMSGSKFF